VAEIDLDGRIDELVEFYKTERDRVISVSLSQIEAPLKANAQLSRLVHSSKSRLKDPDHLRDKLERRKGKLAKEGKEFDVTQENLLTSITDLAGIRLLHLYTRQLPSIDSTLRDVFAENRYELVEPPFARIWDNDLAALFTDWGFEVQHSENYTSVHYVISTASKTVVTCEIQVRTLSEELWGEVDHAINYPHQSPRLACREQLRALARITSSATRLVDSIMMTHEEDPIT
jgi:ppGpp synthetase/RelA/SpoT-type nucleotidyltranferase